MGIAFYQTLDPSLNRLQAQIRHASWKFCHDCNFPICQSCFDCELKEGGKCCLRCGAPYVHSSVPNVQKETSSRGLTMAAHLSDYQCVPVQAGQTPPLLPYFGTLLNGGKLNAF